MVAIVLVSLGSFYQILYYSGSVLIFFASLTVSALFKTSNYPVLPVLFIAVKVLVLVNATISYPWQAFWGLVTVLAGVSLLSGLIMLAAIGFALRELRLRQVSHFGGMALSVLLLGAGALFLIAGWGIFAD